MKKRSKKPRLNTRENAKSRNLSDAIRRSLRLKGANGAKTLSANYAQHSKRQNRSTSRRHPPSSRNGQPLKEGREGKNNVGAKKKNAWKTGFARQAANALVGVLVWLFNPRDHLELADTLLRFVFRGHDLRPMIDAGFFAEFFTFCDLLCGGFL